MRTGARRGGMSGMGSVGDQMPVPLFLEEENQRLKRELEDCHQRQNVQIDDMRGRRLGPACAEMQQELKKLEKKASAQETEIAVLQDDLASSRKKEAALQIEEKKWLDEKAVYDAKVQGLNEQIKLLEIASDDDKKKEIESITSENADKGLQIARLTADVEEKSTKLSELQGFYDQLQDDFGVLQGECNMVREEKGNVEKELEEKQKELEDLGKMYADGKHAKEKLESELQNSQQIIAKLEAELSEAVKNAEQYSENWQRSMTSWKSKHENELKQNEDRVKRSQEEIQILLELIAQLQENLADAVNASLSSQPGTITVQQADYTQLQKLNAELDKERQDLHAENDKVINKLKTVEKELEDTKRKLSTAVEIGPLDAEEMEVVKAWRTEQHGWRVKLTMLKEEELSKIDQLRKLDERKQQYAMSIAGLQAREAELQETIAEKQGVVATLESSIQTLNEQKSELNADIREASELVKDLQEPLGQTADTIEVISNLENAKEDLQREIQQLQQTISNNAQVIADRDQEIKKQLALIAQQQLQLETADENTTQLQNQLAAEKLELRSNLLAYRGAVMILRGQYIKNRAMLEEVVKRSSRGNPKIILSHEDIEKYLTRIYSQGKNNREIASWKKKVLEKDLMEIYDTIPAPRPF